MDTITNNLIQSFDFTYILIINLITYGVIKFIDWINKEKQVTTWQKRLVLIASIIIVTIIYKLIGYDNNLILFQSAVLTPVSWSWILKPICKALKIDYKKIDNAFKETNK